jgi:hypothetical protein
MPDMNTDSCYSCIILLSNLFIILSKLAHVSHSGDTGFKSRFDSLSLCMKG